MGIIVFTRLPRPGSITRKYGDFSFIATADRVWIEGFMFTNPRVTGDQELVVMSEECQAIWADHAKEWKDKGMPDSEETGLKRGSGDHPKAGPFVAYVGTGMVVKITATGTRVRTKPPGFSITGPKHATALSRWFMSVIGDRAAIRDASLHARASGKFPEMGR